MISNCIYSLLFLTSIFFGCTNNSNGNNDFIEKYKDYDFSIFINKSFTVRGFDNENPIILVYDHSKNGRPCGFIRVTVSITDGSMLNYTEVLQSDECVFSRDTSQIIQLTQQFQKLNIFHLKVDSKLNVLVSTKLKKGKPNIGKFRKEDIKLNEWTNIIDNWYERK